MWRFRTFSYICKNHFFNVYFFMGNKLIFERNRKNECLISGDELIDDYMHQVIGITVACQSFMEKILNKKQGSAGLDGIDEEE